MKSTVSNAIETVRKNWPDSRYTMLRGALTTLINEVNDSEVERCPACGAIEIPAHSPRTVYSCGSSTYDARPGSFKKGQECAGEISNSPLEKLEGIIEDLEWYGRYVPEVNAARDNFNVVVDRITELFNELIEKNSLITKRFKVIDKNLLHVNEVPVIDMWETVEEWERRTGREYPEQGPVWLFKPNISMWYLGFKGLAVADDVSPIIVPRIGEGYPPEDFFR